MFQADKAPMPRWMYLGLAKDPLDMTPEEKEDAQLMLLETWLLRRTYGLPAPAAPAAPAATPAATERPRPPPGKGCRRCGIKWRQTRTGGLCWRCWRATRIG